MRFAILSAGNGSRLAQEGVRLPKPLVRVAGEPMIGRLLRIFNSYSPDIIAVIVNPANTQTIDFLNSVHNDYPLEVVVRSTPSSMHSLYELRKYLEGDRFCATTVDTVFLEKEFNTYMNAFLTDGSDGVMAVTDYVDDEKPLFVGVDDKMNITRFSDSSSGCRFVSGGIYGLTGKALGVLDDCVSAGMSRMRAFQKEMVARGLILKAYALGKVIDVDHQTDIVDACGLLNG